MMDDAAKATAWKTEAATLRRIVMEALAEFEREEEAIGCPFPLSDDHWTNRARAALGID